MNTIDAWPQEEFHGCRCQLLRQRYRILVISGFISDRFNGNLMIQFSICTKSQSYRLLMIDIRNTVRKSVQLVKPEMGQ